MASTSGGGGSIGTSAGAAGAASMASARRADTVCDCKRHSCSPFPKEAVLNKIHYHPIDPVGRTPIWVQTSWSRRTAEKIASTMERRARTSSSPACGKGKATGTGRSKAPRTAKKGEKGGGTGKGKGKATGAAAKEISEEAKGGGKSKGERNGKRKVRRATAEEIPKKSPRIGPEFQAVLPARNTADELAQPGQQMENRCIQVWAAPSDAVSEEDKSMDLFTAQLLTEFRADIPEDEILETLHATDRMGIGYRRFTHARATLAHKVAAKAKAAAAAAAATAASAVNVLSLWAKAAIAGSTSLSKGAVATAASAEAFTALSGGAPSAAVPSAEASAVASTSASSSSEAADSPSA